MPARRPYLLQQTPPSLTHTQTNSFCLFLHQYQHPYSLLHTASRSVDPSPKPAPFVKQRARSPPSPSSRRLHHQGHSHTTRPLRHCIVRAAFDSLTNAVKKNPSCRDCISSRAFQIPLSTSTGNNYYNHNYNYNYNNNTVYPTFRGPRITTLLHTTSHGLLPRLLPPL